jgi:hypothetical protein
MKGSEEAGEEAERYLEGLLGDDWDVECGT